jgi:hypothetical protein
MKRVGLALVSILWTWLWLLPTAGFHHMLRFGLLGWAILDGEGEAWDLRWSGLALGASVVIARPPRFVRVRTRGKATQFYIVRRTSMSWRAMFERLVAVEPHRLGLANALPLAAAELGKDVEALTEREHASVAVFVRDLESRAEAGRSGLTLSVVDKAREDAETRKLAEMIDEAGLWDQYVPIWKAAGVPIPERPSRSRKR